MVANRNRKEITATSSFDTRSCVTAGCISRQPSSQFLPSSILLPPPSPSCSLFLMVGGDRSFKLALTEKDKKFSDELREDCEVRGEGRSEEG